MPKIINMDKFDAAKFYPNGGWDLIRISDPAQWLIEIDRKVAKRYNSIHQFEFLDAESGFEEECLFQADQARQIMDILVKALDNDRNVLVHCNMGLCRSGAVVEVGTMIGFEDPMRTRMPNLRVKRLLVYEAMDRNLL